MINTEPWAVDAVCAQVDGDAWFPEVGSSPRMAKAICLTCPAVEACLEYAVRTNQRWGIWGATSYEDRVAMRRAAVYAAKKAVA